MINTILIAALALNLTPAECRQIGVYVPDDAQQTGKIVQETNNASGCATQRNHAGCAIPLEDNQWHIFYSNLCVRQHEWCHAAYQSKNHSAHLDSYIPLGRWLTGCGDVNVFQGCSGGSCWFQRK